MSRPGVLITGGARRIGAVLSRAFAEAGYHVVIHYGRSRDEAEGLAASLPSARTVSCDLQDISAVEAMACDLADGIEDWRVLINCAAIFELDDARTLDPALFARHQAINTAAPVRLTQVFLERAHAASGRRAIQVTDQKLANPNPDFLSYTLSKAGLGAAVGALSMARPRPEDRVYGLAPGAILASHDQTEAETDVSHRLNLLHRKTGADEIAAAALFLATGFVASGTTLFVDSGQHLLDQPRDVLFLARS